MTQTVLARLSDEDLKWWREVCSSYDALESGTVVGITFEEARAVYSRYYEALDELQVRYDLEEYEIPRSGIMPSSGLIVLDDA